MNKQAGKAAGLGVEVNFGVQRPAWWVTAVTHVAMEQGTRHAYVTASGPGLRIP